ncbi:TonB-dependent receptor [Geofilum sp. OHC36d9]|uniref:TonB-dependent receptor n=1 Tax=Geofilum sp. OHC36d9 TaxID=3458413 RepID=UPI004034C768
MRQHKRLMLSVIVIFMTTVLASAQHLLTGKVQDEKRQPLAGAAIRVMPGNKGTVTNANGIFTITDLRPGNYHIEISFLGYENKILNVELPSNKNTNITLSPTHQTLNEVVVKDNYREQRHREETLNIEIVNDEFLRQNRGGSLMQSLSRLPGLSTMTIGSGQSKPVIRGLSFNRIVVVENGIKHQGQQWGDDHGLEIDQFAADRVEVIKGPGAILYGSDAIGGVIDIQQNGVPAENSTGGTIDLTAKSNNEYVGGSLWLYTRHKKSYYTLRTTVAGYGDYKVPTDSVDIYSYRAPLYKRHLRNTAGREQVINFSTGYISQRFQNRLFLSFLNNKNGFFANAHGLEPMQVDTLVHDRSSRDIRDPFHKVNHVKVINRSKWQINNSIWTNDVGYQRNFRQEWSRYTSHGFMPAVFPEGLNFPSDLEREFVKNTFSWNTKGSWNVAKKLKISTGINIEYQHNRIDGRGFIIPAFDQQSAGTFFYGKYSINDQSLLHAGIRYDYGRIHTEHYNDWFTTPVNDTDVHLKRAEELTRQFSSFSWAIGLNRSVDHFNLKGNVGKSYRTPTAQELAANGVNYHRFSYEVGNHNLNPEVAYQVDAGIEWSKHKTAIGITPFLNYFTNYIYLNPTSQHDRLYGNGNQVFYYTQNEVLRYGTEMHIHFSPTPKIKTGFIGEYLYSEQMNGDKKGFTLPWSPPATALFNLKYLPYTGRHFSETYISLDYKLTAPQNRIVPPEEKTDGYQLLNLSAGSTLGPSGRTSINMQIQNIFNTKYFDHTDVYRLINAPRPGTNVIINIKTTF